MPPCINFGVRVIVASLILPCVGAHTARAQRIVDADKYHPRQFLRIVEIGADGDRRVLYGVVRPPGKDGTEPTARTRREVDRRSSIRIEYDRQAIEALDGVGVEIEGAVKGDKETRRIEIPGYSLVGETATTAGVGYIGAGQFQPLTDLLTSHAKTMVTRFNETYRQLEQQRAETRVKAYEAQIAARLRRDSLRVLAQEAEQKLDAARQGLLSLTALETLPKARTDSATAVVKADSGVLRVVRDSLTVAELAANQKDSAVVALSDPRPGIRDALTQIDALSRLLLEDWMLHDIYVQLGDPASKPMVDAVAQSSKATPVVWRAIISRILAGYEAISKPSRPTAADEVYALHRRIFQMRNDVLETSSMMSGVKTAALKDILFGSLRESSFSVSGTGAQVHEEIVLTLRSLIDGGQKREVKVALVVAEHGIVSRITDSFLFLRRNGVRDDGDARVRDRVEAFEKASPLDRQLLSTTVDVPMAEDFTATPGVNFGWIYSPRDDAGSVRRAFRTLKPGWGVNASFPSFSTKQIRIKPPATGNDVATVEAQTVEKQSLGLSVGLFVSLFDGAISYTHGWNLSVPEKRQYDGIGLSFVGLAKQGRELFEKFEHRE